MSGMSASTILASPSAAPHIALGSWASAAAWKSFPAFSISPSAAPRAITASTVVPGQRGGVGVGRSDPAGADEAVGAAGPTAAPGQLDGTPADNEAGDETFGPADAPDGLDGPTIDAPQAATTRARTNRLPVAPSTR